MKAVITVVLESHCMQAALYMDMEVKNARMMKMKMRTRKKKTVRQTAMKKKTRATLMLLSLVTQPSLLWRNYPLQGSRQRLLDTVTRTQHVLDNKNESSQITFSSVLSRTRTFNLVADHLPAPTLLCPCTAPGSILVHLQPT